MKHQAEKKVIEEMANHPKSANWNNTKGNPFDYQDEKLKTKFENPVISLLKDNIEDYDILGKELVDVKFNLHLKSVYEAIKSPIHADKIIQPMEENPWDKEKHISGFEMFKHNDGSITSNRTEPKSVVVYLDYPFEKLAKLEINPYQVNGTKHMNFGYLIWQIANAYAYIYKNKWKEFGVWGHAFDDLYLERLEIRENNIVTTFIGS